ncbi:fused MFS/spermidine synthase [Lapillicoccus sp.]|uniref:spermidine synthase n=1 Tax=Lapillicoccus sp. TaxID=1909287 RepID=UPI0026014205|nr:fused MFS/spermidine synthase [Lapillicoccus sp.]
MARTRRGAGDPAASAPHVTLVSDDRGGVTIVLDGSPQSHVQLSDPGLLAFEYVQHLALVLDTLPGGPIAVTHVGGAGMTLPRYVEHTRPGSPQIVLEPDAALTELVRRELPLPRQHRIRVRPTDGLTGTAALGDDSADALVLDAYAVGRVPAELTTVDYLRDVARVLRPGGIALLNLADEPGMRYVTRVLASLRDVGAFGALALVATQDVLKGRRFGNVVVAASRGGELDIAGLARSVARAAFPTGVRSGADVTRMARSGRPFVEGDRAASPVPPAAGAWRVR